MLLHQLCQTWRVYLTERRAENDSEGFSGWKRCFHSLFDWQKIDFPSRIFCQEFFGQGACPFPKTFYWRLSKRLISIIFYVYINVFIIFSSCSLFWFVLGGHSMSRVNIVIYAKWSLLVMNRKEAVKGYCSHNFIWGVGFRVQTD